MTKQLNSITFPLQGTSLIEASAGTGKTYTIASLYLRLILGHGGINGFFRPLTPPEILVVTFTNAATEELRVRIRSRLNEGAEFFRELSSGDKFLRSLRSSYDPSEWSNNARLLELAALWMDESAICTIHSWCQNILRQHAFESGSLFDLTIETDEAALLEEAACDYWRSYLYPLTSDKLSEFIQLSKCSSPQKLLQKIKPWLFVPEDLLANPFPQLDIRVQAINEARLQWQADFKGAVSKIKQAQQDKILKGNMYSSSSLLNWFDQLTAWVNGGSLLPDLQVLYKFSKSGLASGTAKNKVTPQHAAYDAFDHLVAIFENQKIDISLFKHAARFIKKRVQQEKLRRAQINFDDLLTRLHDALYKNGDNRLAEVIRNQFPVALIDEFQDTDPVQYEIFRKIFFGNPQTGLFMIGDPKQAIYSFRGADIHTYLKARKDSAGSHYTLGTNYRSSTDAVSAVNQIFKNRTIFSNGIFLFKDEIKNNPVAANGREDDLYINYEKTKALKLWVTPQDSPINKTGENGYQSVMAEAAATEIVRLLNSAEQSKTGFGKSKDELLKLKPADIAILVRNFSEAKSISNALASREIRSVYLSDKDSVFQANEIENLFHLLRACAEPARGQFVRAALATEILALQMHNLDKVIHDEMLWEVELKRFRHYNQIWLKYGVLSMLKVIINDFKIAGRLLSEIGGERKLTNLLHIGEILQEKSELLDGEFALIRWLSEKIDVTQNHNSDDELVRLESDEELVKIVTIHKSKGLEYPLVFLPFACNFRQVNRRNSPIVKFRDADGKLNIVSNPDKSILAAADRERLAEDIRMLYVALTRAQYTSVIGVGVIGKTLKNSEKSLLHHSAFGYLLGAGQTICTHELEAKLNELKGDCEAISIESLPVANSSHYKNGKQKCFLEQARKFNGKVVHDWSITSYSGLVSGAHNIDKTDLRVSFNESINTTPNSAIEDLLQETANLSHKANLTPADTFEISTNQSLSIHNFPKGPIPGTFLHDLLEWAAVQGFGKLTLDRSYISEKVGLTCKRNHWDQWIVTITDWLFNLLKIPFIPGNIEKPGAMADIDKMSCQAELEFMFSSQQINTKVLDEYLNKNILPNEYRPSLKLFSIKGMLKGFIDLVFCYNGRYFVLDYKSNYLGRDERSYNQKNMADCILEHRYDLQYVLYTIALHRLLKAKLSGYDYKRDVGGVVYLFLRGVDNKGTGVYIDKPQCSLIEDLDSYFKGKDKKNAA